ncbi:uncharacterized protein LOC122016569 [Zingiber officinale]|uniref:uncharacterized protein LOC122016569 n=1 Tax=Zingiber officinale TaxID=94328 RepID=UPI001C4B8491|nr:uncharacterized protein LOC122016569 [Zingiber officinale]
MAADSFDAHSEIADVLSGFLSDPSDASCFLLDETMTSSSTLHYLTPPPAVAASTHPSLPLPPSSLNRRFRSPAAWPCSGIGRSATGVAATCIATAGCRRRRGGRNCQRRARRLGRGGRGSQRRRPRRCCRLPQATSSSCRPKLGFLGSPEAQLRIGSLH